MSRPFHILATIAAFWVAFAACGGHDRSYSNWAQIPDDGWAYGDTISLVPVDTTLADNDSTLRAPLKLGVSHANDFPFANLWIEVTYRGDNRMYRDTINITLADIYGRWIGKGFGPGLQHEVTLTTHADIDVRKPVSVRHIMRVDTLHGLKMVGISVR